MSIKRVEFFWNDKHGECYDCGRPAAFLAEGVKRLLAWWPTNRRLRQKLREANEIINELTAPNPGAWTKRER